MLSTHRTLWIALVLGGCAAEIGHAPDADNEAALDHVEALGYPREVAEVHATIGVDVLFERDAPRGRARR